MKLINIVFGYSIDKIKKYSIFMHILLLPLFSLCLEKCVHKEGSFIFNVKFHIDEETINKILLFVDRNKKISERDKVIKYVNKVVNSFNKEIEEYGIQVRPDYSQLIFEELNLKIKKQIICMEKYSAAALTRLVSAKLSYPNTSGSGYRIIVISCINFHPEQIPFFAIPSFSLSGQIGIFFSINSSVFRFNACRSAKRCVTNNDLYGRFVKNVEKIEAQTYNYKEL
ncbi:hypothetical protein NAPIS_ORF00273 [Vairimorpha apis BRL 01]|uniref:Uncharacterized protein n=1 Tax=Vairimorpha apis BRL 01 TaxID=1037528 RepID=T0MMB4_9MICR|nr:hypothetical protein NAPIS_ORF00273 [Vairimorpha apis BRL 01]